jgi:hypothetical protein
LRGDQPDQAAEKVIAAKKHSLMKMMKVENNIIIFRLDNQQYPRTCSFIDIYY